MSKTAKDRMRLAADLVRKGGVLLGEPCQQCGGIQIRYRGKVYCTNHEDLTSVLKISEVSYDTVVAGMKETHLSRLNEAVALLSTEKDAAKQDQLVSLMTKYFDLLQKLPQK